MFDKETVSISLNQELIFVTVEDLRSPTVTECSLRNLTRGLSAGCSHTSVQPRDRVLNLA